ncbi:MAG: GntR family transcriptional regulator [Kineosporiaceae bacterium]|nr:GntR family transcriptional regulator [Kineosporiaceae bacterium]MBK7623620.1 GntR family transcriptional regulator [Kineosporiaceae bacterium]MBK8077965.1 GntR family transcriptional regulator [Kineosporiaceae bacterium]
MSDLVIHLDPDAAQPPFEQLKARIAAMVDNGTLRAGDQLPTVRRLAADLGLAPNTVARAYRELEQSGLLDTRGRSGTFVSGDQVHQEARRAAVDFVVRLRALGIGQTEALDLVRRSFG